MRHGWCVIGNLTTIIIIIIIIIIIMKSQGLKCQIIARKASQLASLATFKYKIAP